MSRGETVSGVCLGEREQNSPLSPALGLPWLLYTYACHFCHVDYICGPFIQVLSVPVPLSLPSSSSPLCLGPASLSVFSLSLYSISVSLTLLFPPHPFLNSTQQPQEPS